ncbi:MAG: precorrin-2 C(20)-methyltransferase [Desulfobacterales bacterium]|nr:MAG: precorrin-2 C(20)-methyltransferase [Desulfobacterales bacterium]
MKAKTGTLYGIGVGPGDPELITLKAAKLLGRVHTVYAAASTKNPYSLAVNIARPHIPPTTPVCMLRFPMTRDRNETHLAWQAHAATIIAELECGKDVAFLTLGDSLTYSTYGYVVRLIRTAAPHLPVKTIPGITSYQAAAACLNTPLVEGEESLMVVSGVKGGDHLRQLSHKPDTVVFLKAYRNVPDISSAVEESGLYHTCVGVKHCGLANEEIVPDLNELGNRAPDYWTLIIAKHRAENGLSKG